MNNRKKVIFALLLVVAIIWFVRGWGGGGAEDEYYKNLSDLPELQGFEFDVGQVLGEGGERTLLFEAIEVRPGLSLERTVYVSETDGLEWNLSFESTDFEGEYIHIENIPKSFAEDVSQIEFSMEPDIIIDADPSVAWIMSVSAGLRTSLKMKIGMEYFLGGKDAAIMSIVENFDDVRIFVGLEKCRLAKGDYGRLLCMIDLIGKNPEKFTLEHCKGLADFKQVDHEEGIAEMQACRAFLKNDISECENYEVYGEDEYSSIHCEKHAFLTAYASCLGKEEMQKDYCIAEKAVWAGYAEGCSKASNILPYQRCLAQVNQDDDACVKLMNYEDMFSEDDYISCCELLEEESYRERCIEYVSDEKEPEKRESFMEEFNCPIPAGAEHIVKTSISADYWQKDGKKVGPSSVMYDEQKVFNCYNINGEQHGIQKSWYEDGTLHSERNYKDDKQDGVQKSWYEDGTLKSESNYKDGKQHGVQKEWDESGELVSECNYKDGVRHGKCMTWRGEGIYENGVEIEYESSLIDQSVEFKGFK